MKKFGRSMAALSLALCMGASVLGGPIGENLSVEAYSLDQTSAFAAANLTDQALYNSMGYNGYSEVDTFSLGKLDLVFMNQFSGNLCVNMIVTGGNGLVAEELTYNSLDDRSGIFGDGISGMYTSQVIDNRDGTFLWIDQKGVRSIFRNNGNGLMQNVNRDTLTITDTGYTVNISGGLFTFNQQGKITMRKRISPYENYEQVVHYADNGLISYVESFGKITEYAYNAYSDVADAKVKTMTTVDASTNQITGLVRLSYEGSKLTHIDSQDLVSPDSSGAEIFTYDENGNMIGVGDGQITYVDSTSGKVAEIKQFSSTGTLEDHKQYLYGNYQTVILDKNGKMTLKKFDQDGNLIR